MKVTMLNNCLTRFIQIFHMRGTLFFLLCMPVPAWAGIQVDGMSVPDVTVIEGQTLALNGAAVRSVFLFDIYLAALYLSKPSSNGKLIMQTSRPAQLRMEFLHAGAGHDMLSRSWRKGFERNQSHTEMILLASRLKKFNSMFGDIHKGDVFVFDFLSNGSTRISFNGHLQGIIHGAEFQRALLAIWLGIHPVDTTLKQALLQAGNFHHTHGKKEKTK